MRFTVPCSGTSSFFAGWPGSRTRASSSRRGDSTYVSERDWKVTCKVGTDDGEAKEVTFPYGVIFKYSDGAVPRLTRGTGGEPVVTLPVPSPSNVPYAVPAVAGDVIVPFEDGSWVKEAGDRLEFRVMVDGRVRARELNPWEVVLRDDRVPHCKATLREAGACVPTGPVTPARSA